MRDVNAVPIEAVIVSAYRVPTATPESDGTLAWDSTTLVLVQIEAGGLCGIGYSYADKATAKLVHERFVKLLVGCDALAIAARWRDMRFDVRNLGASGVSAMAISAVDNALWDWKSKFMGVPLVTLLGAAHDSILIYGSGGFTSYTDQQLCEQLSGWAREGIRAVKMKVGREPERDVARVAAARRAIGDDVALFVDANGAYTRKQALLLAQGFAESNVTWFEEPVSSDDLEGLRLLRDRAPAGMNISAGEYGYTPDYFRRMLESQAVDVLQADATRCCGLTGFLGAAALCEAFHVPLSSHCAPALHVAATCAARPAIHLEYFFDHVRLEQMLFDGVGVPSDGMLAADSSRLGLGIELKKEDAECYRI
nr:enolase C-terminal domain-like protein [uncultured Steroidobacter sp.]